MKKQFDGENHRTLRTFNGNLANVYHVKLCHYISVFSDSLKAPDKVLLIKLCVCFNLF